MQLDDYYEPDTTPGPRDDTFRTLERMFSAPASTVTEIIEERQDLHGPGDDYDPED